MTFQTGNKPRRRTKGRFDAAFTLIELILVMALLMVVLGVAAPTLQRFFKGRNLDSEARRILSLTKFGQSRAVSEGVPMVLWIDQQQRSYGLREAAGYDPVDNKAVEYALGDNLEIQAFSPSAFRMTNMVVYKEPLIGNLPMIRFGPDGSIDDTSPDRILIIQSKSQDQVWIAENQNRLRYEIQAGNNDATTRF